MIDSVVPGLYTAFPGTDFSGRQHSMAITPDEVLYTAHLARLELTPEQIQRFTRDAKRILEHIDQLHEADVTDVQPQTQFIRHRDFFRADRVTPSLSREDALANAPDTKDGMFRVPQAID